MHAEKARETRQILGAEVTNASFKTFASYLKLSGQETDLLAMASKTGKCEVEGKSEDIAST